jgi:hypothetical protein
MSVIRARQKAALLEAFYRVVGKDGGDSFSGLQPLSFK